MDFPSRVHQSLYGKNDDPEHADNRRSPEFLDGYAQGMIHDKGSGLDAVADEWERRGRPNEASEDFREWKRGFNAATLRKSWQTAQERAKP